ncbi:MAG: hypothetical protein U0R76_06395 [Candidatus Nanopelagicales bacterium]
MTAPHVVAGHTVGLALADVPDGEQRREDGDRHVDQQAPAPREVLGEDAAEQQAEGRTAAGDRAVDAERAGALLRVVERHGDQRERRGRQQRREGALQGAGAEQPDGVGRDAAERGRRREAEQADDEGALAAGVVGDAAAEQEQAAEGERVGGDHPLLVGVADAEVGLGGRERQVDDRGVEDRHERGHADDEQGAPAHRVERDAGGAERPVLAGRVEGDGRARVGGGGHAEDLSSEPGTRPVPQVRVASRSLPGTTDSRRRGIPAPTRFLGPARFPP